MIVKILKSILLIILFLSCPGMGLGEESDGGGDRFVVNANGTVMDKGAGLMWAVKDNGEDVNWQAAKRYCEQYRGGGYKDWRMPTQEELAGLYDHTRTYVSACGNDVNLTEAIRLSCAWAWAAEQRGSDAALFYFSEGRRIWRAQSFSHLYRALPVRSVK